MATRTYISVDLRDCDGGLQICIGIEGDDGSDHGYRIAGPKYDGRGKTLLRHYITERDAREIKGYLEPEKRPKYKYDKAKRTLVEQVC